jgi:hypothetical protein
MFVDIDKRSATNVFLSNVFLSLKVNYGLLTTDTNTLVTKSRLAYSTCHSSTIQRLYASLTLWSTITILSTTVRQQCYLEITPSLLIMSKPFGTKYEGQYKIFIKKKL